MPPEPAAKADPGRIRRVYRRAAERREEILVAAQKAFAASTFAGARTRDIAQAAGVNQATLFKFFPTKEKLFEEAVMKPLVAAMENMHERIEVYGAAENPQRMAELAEASTARHLADMDQILPLLATALFSDPQHGRRLFEDHLQPLIRERGEVLRPLVKDGLDPAFVGLASFGMMFAVALQRRYGDRSDNLPALARQFNRLSTSGFARSGPAGREEHASEDQADP